MRRQPWDLFWKIGKNYSDLLLLGALHYDYQVPPPRLFNLVQHSNKYTTPTIWLPALAGIVIAPRICLHQL